MKIARSLPASVFFALVFVAFAAIGGHRAGVAADSGDFDRARALFGEKRYSEAIALLDPFIQTHPRDARALALRGDSRASMGDDVGALKDYDAAIGADPEYAYAYATRCDTRRNVDNLSGALTDCDTAIKLDPTDGLAYENRGDVYFDRDAYDAALADYDRAIDHGRSGAYVFAARCDAERLAHKLERAPADCDRALTLDPQSRRGLWASARLLATEQQYAKAISDLNAYIAQKPAASDNAYYFRGFAYNRTGQYRLALDDEQTYIDRHTDDADAHAERGVARYNLGDKAGAASDLQFALAAYHKDGDDQNVARVKTMIATSQAGGTLP